MAFVAVLAGSALAQPPGPPQIDSFSPTSGPVGTTVTINGQDLQRASVRFNGTPATITSNTQSQIITSVPAGAKTGPITVTTSRGNDTSSSSFTVTVSSTPQISSFSPTRGPVGASVTINGQHLSGATVRFNGTLATVQTDNATQIKTTVPSGATTGPISVTTSGGTATSSASFSVQANIVFILTDDQRADEIWGMPTVQSELVGKGKTFNNGFVTDPLCCPSRASILTGQYAHTHGVYDNTPPNGGFSTFTDSGDDRSTIATWLHGGGYYTGIVGKYFLGYHPVNAPYIAPGWDVWDVQANGKGPQGLGNGNYYRYYMSINGTLNYHGTGDANYSTDVFTGYATNFINTAPANKPLFLYYAPRAPHLQAQAPTRYQDSFSNLAPLRPPSFNEADVSDKPAYVRAISPLTSTQESTIDANRRRQFQALMPVDDGVKAILNSLAATGRLTDTLIVFTSDNAIQLGEHRLTGKEVPYEETIRVPLIVRYDPITNKTASTNSNLAVNIDFAPTLADVGGVSAPGAVGSSLLPLLRGSSPGWRTDFLLESSRHKLTVPPYCGVRNTQYAYVKYATGEEELYDLNADPYELDNLAGNPGYATIKTTLYNRMQQLCSPPPPGFTP